MQRMPTDLYLDLMKKALSFTLWPEPAIPAVLLNTERARLARLLVRAVDALLAPFGMLLAQRRGFSEADRLEGRIWPGLAHTMIGLKRLDNLQQCLEQVLRDGVPGDFVETGVWRGGACIFMRAVLAAYGVGDRRVFVADSFQGLPPPDDSKYPADRHDTHHTHGFLMVSKSEVADNFAKYGLLDDQVVFLEGWFSQTLPRAPIERLALLRLDGDMYGSTMDALEHLYPKLSAGGFCLIDDYALPACRKAVEEYREAHGIREPVQDIDYTGRYWRKV